MLSRLSGFVQSYSVQIVVAVVVITIVFAGTLPSIEVLTNWEEFTPDNQVSQDLTFVNNNFGRASKLHYIYVEAGESGDVLSPKALREQYRITLAAQNVTGVEDVLSVAEFINLGIPYVTSDPKDILEASDGDIEAVKIFAGVLYNANFTGNETIDFDVEEAQNLMATLLPEDFDPQNIRANSTLIIVRVFGSYDEPEFKRISLNIRDAINEMDFEEIEVEQTSNALLTYDVDQSVWNTTVTLGIAIFILIIVLLAISFRDYTYVLLPILTLMVVAVWTFGTMVVLGIDFTVVEVAVLPLVVGLGIDYSVHISRRYQEELKKGKNVSEALTESVRRVGSALSLAVATTIIAFFSNMFSEIIPIRNFGILVGLGIFYAFFLTITFQVALRFLLDSKSGGISHTKKKIETPFLDRGMSAGAKAVRKHAILLIVVVLLLTGLLGFLATEVETEFSLEDFVPQEWPTMRTTNLIRDEYSSASYTQEYILLKGNITDPDILVNMALMEFNIEDDTHVVALDLLGEKRYQIYSIRRYIKEAVLDNGTLGTHYNITDEGLPQSNTTSEDVFGIYSYLCNNETYGERVKSVVQLNDEGEFDSTVIRVLVSSDKTDESRIVYSQLKDDIIKTQGVSARVTGETILVITTIDSFQRSQVVSTAFSVILSALVLMIVYRNFTLGIIAVIPVALSTIWILGTMFLLGISINVFTVMVTALTIGLGIDYSIHIIERFREERKSQGPKESMQTTIERTGSAIFISALTTICGFAVLLLSPMPLTQHFGMITAATIFYSFDLAVFVLPILLVAWAIYLDRKKN
jgi:hydrophobe/amphiphile efflux-3 (HAE3) family protein